jgi:hypothetical protein
LHAAAQHGRKDVVELLLAKGGEVDAKNDHGWAPVHLAVFGAHKDVADLLRRHGGPDDLYAQGKLPELHTGGKIKDNNNKFFRVEIAHCAPNRKFALFDDEDGFEGSLFMLDDQNNILWALTGCAPITSMPIMDSKGIVYLVGLDLTWVALDSSNAEVKWSRGFMFMGSVVYSQIKLYKDDMYFVVWDMRGYWEKSGKIENNMLELCKGDLSLWSTEIPALSTIHVENGKVFYTYKRHSQIVKHAVSIPKTFPKAKPFVKESFGDDEE